MNEDTCATAKAWFANKVLDWPIDTLHFHQVMPAFLLFGGWNTRFEAEKNELSCLTGLDFGSLEQMTQLLEKTELGSQLIEWVKKRSSWTLRVKEDAWQLALNSLTPTHLTRFREIAIHAFTEEARTDALGHKDVHDFSKQTRRNMAEALVRLALVKDETMPAFGQRQPQAYVDSLLMQVFDDLNIQKLEFWCSIGDELGLLVEAAPDVILEAIEQVCDTYPAVFGDLFSSSRNLLGDCLPSWEGVNLIYALKTLSWNS